MTKTATTLPGGRVIPPEIACFQVPEDRIVHLTIAGTIDPEDGAFIPTASTNRIPLNPHPHPAVLQLVLPPLAIPTLPGAVIEATVQVGQSARELLVLQRGRDQEGFGHWRGVEVPETACHDDAIVEVHRVLYAGVRSALLEEPAF